MQVVSNQTSSGLLRKTWLQLNFLSRQRLKLKLHILTHKNWHLLSLGALVKSKFIGISKVVRQLLVISFMLGI